jgi:hypothetical protein
VYRSFRRAVVADRDEHGYRAASRRIARDKLRMVAAGVLSGGRELSSTGSRYAPSRDEGVNTDSPLGRAMFDDAE